MDATELVTLGTNISEVSTKLTAARKVRDDAQTEVTKLEAELQPLLLKHAQIIAQLAGAALPQGVPVAAPVPIPAPGPAPMGLGRPATPPPVPAVDPARARIKAFLQNLPEGEPIFAADVASALELSPILVREVMLELRDGPRR